LSDKLDNDIEKLAASLDAAARTGGIAAEVPGLASRLTPDEPIHSSSQDLLNRSGFATELARAIVSLDRGESVVVGIHGKWGTGKTSLLNLIKEKLETVSPDPPVIFRFNPWGFANQDSLIIQFFDDLSEFLKLHKTISPLATVADAVEEYGRVLSPLARLIFPRAAESVEVGWRLFTRLKPAKRTAAELKNQINSALARSGVKLIIVIDDIDRLDAREIRETFQLIKVNANFSNTVYVVAFDTRPVEEALKTISPGPATEYLEKIVQVSFNLPPISQSTLSEMIIANFNEILADRAIDTQRFGNMFESGFKENFHTIRDVNRYFNLFRFAFNLMSQDTNFVDLAAIQAVALFYPPLYHSIHQNADMFQGTWSSHNRPSRESLKEKYEEIYNQVSRERRQPAISVCRFLFPKVEYVYGQSNTFWGPDWTQAWEKERRICTSKYFSYYFDLTVPETDVSQAEMNKALDSAHSLDTFLVTLANYLESKRFGAFIDLLRNCLDKLDHQRLLVILESIFVFGDRVSTEGPSMFFGIISDHVRFRMWLFYDLVDRLGEGRFNHVVRFMTGHSAVFTITNIAAMCEHIVTEKTNPARQSQHAKYPDLTDEIVKQMKNAAVEAISEAALNGRLKSVPSLPYVLIQWKEWNDREHVIEWIKQTFLQGPSSALQFIAAFAQPITSMSISDKVPKVKLVIAIKVLADFVDLNELSALVHEMDDSELSSEERLTKALFLKEKAMLDNGIDPGSPTALMDDDSDRDV
jgi:predicted KAP-like P-loop ATPase